MVRRSELFSTYPEIDFSAGERKPRWLSKKKKILLGTIALVATPPTILLADIALTKHEYSLTNPTVITVSEAEVGADRSATILIDGFGEQSGVASANYLSEAIGSIEPGAIWAVRHDEDGIDPESIADAIADKIDNHPHRMSSISLYGISAGGVTAAQVAIFLVEKHRVPITGITFDSTPIDGESVRPSQRILGDRALGAIELFHTVGIDIEYSKIARAVIDNNDTVHIDASTPLLRDQYIAAQTSNILGDLEKLDELSWRNITYTYVMTDEPRLDYMIDVERSAHLLKEYDPTTRFIEVEGLVHSVPERSIDAYDVAFSAAANDTRIAMQQARDEAIRQMQQTAHDERRIGPYAPLDITTTQE